MGAITVIEDSGARHDVEVEPGTNLMEAATRNMVPGVLGMCGGICSCATCHCYVPDQWRDKLPPPSDGELQMLDAVTHRRANSRLGCQVVVDDAFDGMTVKLPPDQDAG